MNKYETENINEHFNNNIICELDVKKNDKIFRNNI